MIEFIKKHIDQGFKYENMPFPTQILNGPQGTLLSRIGQIEDKIYFLKKGIIQVSIFNSNDDERIVDFFFPNSFFCSYTSLLNAGPSDVEIRAISDFEVEIVSKQSLYESYKHFLLANQLGRIVTEQLYLRKVKREKDFLTKTADEQYLDLIKEQSPLLTHLSIDKLAKYLGIHPESLSRIRRKKMNY